MRRLGAGLVGPDLRDQMRIIPEVTGWWACTLAEHIPRLLVGLEPLASTAPHTIAVLTALLTPLKTQHAETVGNREQRKPLI